MKKMLMPVIAATIIAVFYIVSSGNGPMQGKGVVDADTRSGGDDDAGRAEYELAMLRDPVTGRIPDHIRQRELDFAASLPQAEWGGTSALEKTTSTTWSPRGPWNVGGRTRAFAIDVTNENILIAGSCSGGMWRSTDQGTSWVQTTPTTLYKSVTSVAQDTRPGHRNVWYFSTGEGDGASASATGAYYQGDGIYRSVDSGVTWSLLPSTSNGHLATFNIWTDITWKIVMNPADTSANGTIYVAAYSGIYKSTDAGATWTFVLGTGNTTNAFYSDIDISSSGVIYATLSSDGNVHRGLFRSADGVAFTNITPAGFPSTYNRVKIGISPLDENQVFILGNTPGSGIPDTNFLGQVEWNSLWKYKYISGDGSGAGGVVQNLSPNLPSHGGFFDKYTCQGSYDIVVKVKPTDTNIVFIGGTNVYRSTSGFLDTTHTSFIGGYQPGATLPVVNSYTNHHPDQHELLFLPSNPDKMFSTNDGGIFMTNDNTAATVAWNSLNHGYLTTMFYTCAIDHAMTNDIIIGGAQDNGSWYTNSATLTAPWVTPRSGDGSFCAIADSGKAYYFSIQSGKMMRAKLNGAGGVDSFARIDPIGGFGYQFINPYVLDPNNNNLMYLAAGRGVWRNNNLSGIPYAGNWDTISTNWIKFTDSLPPNAAVTAFGICKAPANRLYYGTSYKRIFKVDNANIGFPTRVDITPTMFPANTNISCIAVDPTDGDHIMAVISNYSVYSLFYSNDGGTTWAKCGGNLEANSAGSGDGPSCRWASIIPLPGGNLYLVGTSVGLYATSFLNDTNTVWVQQGVSTIGASVVDMIDFRASDGLVVVATHSNGIFSAHITSLAGYTTAVSSGVVADPGLALTSYPNPFQNATTIKFDLEQKSNVSLVVYDESGRVVQVLADGQLDAGVQQYQFQATQFSTGIYYCTLRVGNHSETRKLLLAR